MCEEDVYSKNSDIYVHLCPYNKHPYPKYCLQIYNLRLKILLFQQVKLRLVILGSKDRYLLSICRMIRVTVHKNVVP